MKKLQLFLALALATGLPAAAVTPTGPVTIEVLDSVDTQLAGSPGRVAIHNRSTLSPPARVYSVRTEGQKLRIGLLWPEGAIAVPAYEYITLVDLPPLASGDWEIEAYATASPENPPSGAGARTLLRVRDPLVGLAYAGPPRPDDRQEIPLRLSHRPCAGQLTIESAPGRVVLRGTGCWTAAPEGWLFQLAPLATGSWTIELQSGDQGIRDRIALEILPAETVLAGDFEVEVGWQNAAGESGQGRLVQAPSADSALFYFFSPENWELMVKVLDGCHLNGHYWVFGAASTDVGFTLDVKRRNSSQTWRHQNPLGTAAKAITSIEAFPCDPGEL